MISTLRTRARLRHGTGQGYGSESLADFTRCARDRDRGATRGDRDRRRRLGATAWRGGRCACRAVRADGAGPIKDEAVIRFAGYLRQQPSVIRSLKAGSVELDYAVTGFVRPFVNCGAKGLLSPFVRRRALPAVESS